MTRVVISRTIGTVIEKKLRTLPGAVDPGRLVELARDPLDRDDEEDRRCSRSTATGSSR